MSEHIPGPRLQPSASYSFTMRLHLPQQGGTFAAVAHAIADAQAMLGAIDLVRVESDQIVRDVTVACVDSGHAEAVRVTSGSLEEYQPHSGTMSGIFCIPPAFDGIIDGSSDLPGPGAVSMPGTMQLLSPSGAFVDGFPAP